MIDKVEVRVPAQAPFSPDFAKLYRDLSNDTKSNPFRPARHYLRVGDMRKFGYEAILHMTCVHDKHGNHKLELVDTGKMSLQRMRHEIETIFDVNALGLPLMRLDLAADVPGVTVEWFMSRVRARYKRWVADIGTVQCARMGNGGVQTVYLGKRPNCFRIYDKIAEWHHDYAQKLRGVSDAAEMPSFDEVYGYPGSGVTLTRVERQMAGGHVPTDVETFGKLKTARNFNPFSRLDLLVGIAQEPQIEKYGFHRYACGYLLSNKAKQLGMHRLRAFVNKHSGGHASRIFEEYREFLPPDTGLTAERLFEIYRDSVGRQLAA